MTQTLTQFADRAARYPAQLEADRKKAANRSALAITTAVRKQIRSDTGDSRMSGVGRRGARVGARYRQLPSGDVRIQATGPLHLLEGATAAHEIRPRRRGGRKALKVDGGYYAAVQHPGSRAQRTWTRGVHEGVPAGVKEYEKVISAGFVRALTS